MPNDVKLQEGHPVDENLRPLKVGGKSTALELADTDNGARIRGDLEVTGDIKGNVKDVELDLTKIVSNDLTIDDSGDISLDADGGEIYLKDNDATFGDFSTQGASSLTLYENGGASADDYFKISVATHGVTTISTVNALGLIADFTVDAGGDIALDSANGSFIAKKAGTEFSVAKSAYAGMILGYTTDGIDAADDSYTLTTSFTVTDSLHRVKFVAHPSGVVEIFVSIFADTARRYIHFGLSDNSTYNTLDVTHEHEVYIPGGTQDELQLNHYWVITGLTPGTAYEYWLGAKITVGSGGVLRWGGDVTGEWSPFIMKATALPTAVTDYAVYG